MRQSRHTKNYISVGQILAQRDASRRARALKTKLSLKTDERRAMDETSATLAAAAARVAQAELALVGARLHWST